MTGLTRMPEEKIKSVTSKEVKTEPNQIMEENNEAEPQHNFYDERGEIYKLRFSMGNFRRP